MFFSYDAHFMWNLTRKKSIAKKILQVSRVLQQRRRVIRNKFGNCFWRSINCINSFFPSLLLIALWCFAAIYFTSLSKKRNYCVVATPKKKRRFFVIGKWLEGAPLTSPLLLTHSLDSLDGLSLAWCLVELSNHIFPKLHFTAFTKKKFPFHTKCTIFFLFFFLLLFALVVREIIIE